MEKRDNSSFISGLKQLNIELNDIQLNQFEIYYDLLIEWNKVMNLTGITEYEEVISKHFLDSLSIVKAMDLKSVHSLIDIGTGAGFPGIPIKIAFPDINVTLLDSLNKRVNFLNEVIDKCSLKNITAVHGRAEEFLRIEDKREKYDLVVSRAVARLCSLSELCIPYSKIGGYFISYKSDSVDNELDEAMYAIDVLGAKKADVCSFTLPDSDLKRKLIMINKIKHTPEKYPRSGGKPLNQPLMSKNVK